MKVAVFKDDKKDKSPQRKKAFLKMIKMVKETKWLIYVE